MPIYYHVEVDSYSDHAVRQNPDLPTGTSFFSGRQIASQLPRPLLFVTDYPSEPPHILGNWIPVFSGHLIRTLEGVGVDNFEAFPAVVKNPQTGAEWHDYFAFNSLGLVAAANMDMSEYDILMEGDSEGIDMPLVGFHTIVLNKRCTHDFLLFRIAQSPSVLIVHDLVMQMIDAHTPSGGWGFDATEIDVI